MESLSKQELISTITKQADQIKRYEGRLRGKQYLTKHADYVFGNGKDFNKIISYYVSVQVVY